MKKKLIVTMIALITITSAVSAAPFFQVGPLISYNRTVVEMEEESFDINNASIGADVRLTLFKHLGIDIPATIGFGDEGSVSIAALPTINVNIPITSMFDLAIGVGTQFDFLYVGGDYDTWTMNGYEMDNAADAFAKSKLMYRVAATVNLGFISVGLNAMVPGKATFDSGDWDILNPLWEETRVSAVVLFNFG